VVAIKFSAVRGSTAKADNAALSRPALFRDMANNFGVARNYIFHIAAMIAST
jgi:hypothetical protein